MSDLIDKEIAALVDRVAVARSALNDASDALYLAKDALKEARNRKHGIELDQTIIQSKGQEYLVTGAQYYSSGKPHLSARKKLKSGGWHKTATTIWSTYEIVGTLADATKNNSPE